MDHMISKFAENIVSGYCYKSENSGQVIMAFLTSLFAIRDRYRVSDRAKGNLGTNS